VTTKEDAKTKLAEDSSMMMERSLQVQPSVENSLLSMQDSIDSPHKGIFHILDLIGMHNLNAPVARYGVWLQNKCSSCSISLVC
jgi:hypothetical protein